jgi:translocation and assembly module TamA
VRRFVALCVLVAACAHARLLPKTGTPYLIALDLQTVGSDPLDKSDILPRLGLQAMVTRNNTKLADNSEDTQLNGAIDEYQLQLDTQRIVSAYQKLGYFAVDVKTRIDKPPNSDAMTLVFVVNPGKRATVHLEFFGLPDDVKLKQVLAAVGIKEGSRYDYERFDASKEPLGELLQNSGYAHARLQGTTIADKAMSRATIRYIVDPGPRSTFGEVQLSGLDKGILADAVLARIAFVRGQKFSHKAIVDTQAAIYGIGLFSTVRVEPSNEDIDPVVAVKVSVTPVTKNEASAGFGAGLDPTAYSLRLRGTWTRHGIITPLTTSALDLRPEYAFESATCSSWYRVWTCKRDFRGRLVETITQQDLFAPEIKGDVEGGVDYLVYEAYTKLGAHVRLGISSPIFTKKLQLRVGWLYQLNDFPTIYVDDTTKPLGLHAVNYVGAYTGALVLDLRDHAINTTFGIYAELRVAQGTPAALGRFTYTQVTPEVRGYLPISKKLVLAARARFGTLSGNVPATERYFGGGTSSMRGFGARQLSPFEPALADANKNLPVGGAGLFETSFELRTPPLFRVFGLDLDTLVFLDGGDVTFAASDLNLAHLHWATGVGLRFVTPIGPIGLDVAYRLNRTNATADNPDPGTRFNFLFAVGEAF